MTIQSLRAFASLAVAAVVACASSASGQIVFDMPSNNGFFTPFDSSNANSGIRYGDSGWLGGPGSPPAALTKMTLHLATFGSAVAGSTDLKITVNDGDASGFGFGPGTALFSTTFLNVTLPAEPSSGNPKYFDLVVPLPFVTLSGNFNNVGYTVQCQNFNFQGEFGFQVSTGFPSTGFYLNNASYYDGSNWSLFSFGGPAIFATTLEIPAPGSVGLLAIGGLVAVRRRR